MVLNYKHSVLILLLFSFSCTSERSEQISSKTEKNNTVISKEEALSLYSINCASCHGADGALKASEAADLTKSKISDLKIRSTILNGNSKGMIAYRELFTKQEIEGLITLVKQFRTLN
jgi:mono/diheme cytochrome c family protein